MHQKEKQGKGINGLVMSVVSDLLYGLKGKKVTATLIDSENIVEGLFVDSDSTGIAIRGKDDDDNEFLGFYPFRQIIEVKTILSVVQKPKNTESGLMIDDSDDLKLRLLKTEVEKTVLSTLGKNFEVSMDEDTIEITNADGETTIDGDYEELTVYDESSFDASKKIAVIIGAKKITRDYREE